MYKFCTSRAHFKKQHLPCSFLLHIMCTFQARYKHATYVCFLLSNHIYTLYLESWECLGRSVQSLGGTTSLLSALIHIFLFQVFIYHCETSSLLSLWSYQCRPAPALWVAGGCGGGLWSLMVPGDLGVSVALVRGSSGLLG